MSNPLASPPTHRNQESSPTRKPLAELPDGNVIVYDPLRQKLFKCPSRNVANDDYIEIPTQNRSRFDVNVEVGRKKTSVFLATVDLGKLGMKVGWQAKRGKIPSIYVLGHVPGDNTSDDKD